LPLVSRELERSGTNYLLDLLLRRRSRDPRRHHEGRTLTSQRIEHGTKALGEFERESLFVNGRDLRRVRHEELAKAINPSPALQRLYAVLRQDRLPVVPSQAVAQRKRVLHAIWRHGGPIDHLRLNLKVLVRTEERVVHKIAVVPRDIGGRPHGIENFQIGVRHEAEGLPAILGVD
jgi:hypothetical protein